MIPSLGDNTSQSGGLACFAHISGFLLGVLGGFIPRLV